MKKTRTAIIAVFFLLVPLTLVVGSRLPGRPYYLTSTLIVVELLIPFLLAFEGRRPQARELVVVAVMCALAVAGRVAIPIPNFKAIFAIVMVAGMAFGPETGFLVGAVSALSSDFFYSQGPYTPWQMVGYGAAGLLAGCFYTGRRHLPAKPVPMAVFGFVSVLLVVGPILDTSTVFLAAPNMKLTTVLSMYASGFPVNLSQATATALVLLLLGRPLLDKLDRVKQKYGMTEELHGV